MPAGLTEDPEVILGETDFGFAHRVAFQVEHFAAEGLPLDAERRSQAMAKAGCGLEMSGRHCRDNSICQRDGSRGFVLCLVGRSPWHALASPGATPSDQRTSGSEGVAPDDLPISYGRCPTGSVGSISFRASCVIAVVSPPRIKPASQPPIASLFLSFLQGLKESQAVGGTKQRFTSALRVGHQAQYVEILIGDPGDKIRRAIRVPFR